METLKYKTAERPQPIEPKQEVRGHAFLLTLLALMATSLVVWAYFLYFVPELYLEDIQDSFVPSASQANVQSSLEADLNAAGSINNASEIDDIDQAFN